MHSRIPWYGKFESVLLNAKPLLIGAGVAIIAVTGFFIYEVAVNDKYSVPFAGWLAYLYAP